MPSRVAAAQIDIVDPDAGPHDRLEPRLTLQNGRRELGGAANDDAVGLVERFAHLLGRQARPDVDFDFRRLLEDFESGRGKVVGNQDAKHGQALVWKDGDRNQIYG